MNYIKITEKIAGENNITPQEVEKEIRKALEAADIFVEPDVFINIVSEKLKKRLP